MKTGSALAERVEQEKVGRFTALADSAWWQLQLPVEKPWSMTGRPFVCFLAQTGVENTPPCSDSISGNLGSVLSPEERSLVGGPRLLNVR